MKNGNQKKIKKIKQLTPRQKKFGKFYVKTGNATYAAKMAGYAHPGQQGHVTLKKIENSDEFLQMMDAAGLSEDKLFEPVVAGLKANQTAKFEGDVYESDVPDHEVRMHAAEIAFKLRGRLGKNEEDDHSDKPKLIFVVPIRAGSLLPPQNPQNGNNSTP